MRALPADVAGPDNDLADVLDGHITRAIGDPFLADLYAFGQRWGPEDGVPEKVFGFAPGNGVHDIHMNQGNDPAFARDDGVWQDGRVPVRSDTGQWIRRSRSPTWNGRSRSNSLPLPGRCERYAPTSPSGCGIGAVGVKTAGNGNVTSRCDSESTGPLR